MTDATQLTQDEINELQEQEIDELLNLVEEVQPDTFKSLMLVAPEGHLDPKMVAIIEDEWADEPTAIQVLKVLDQCVHGGLASDFTVFVLSSYITQQMEREQITEDQLLEQATWRV